MRVAIDIRAVNGQRAGIGAYVIGLIQGLSSIDKDNIYYLINDDNSTLPLLGENFQQKTFRPGPGYHLKVARFVKKNKVVFHSTFSLIPPVLIGRNSVLTIHDLTAITDPQLHTFKVRTLNNLLFSRAVNSCGHLITPTRFIREQLVARVPQLAQKISVVYEAAPDDFGISASSEVLKKYKLKPNYYLFNGTLEPRKNVELLLEAYSKIDSSRLLVLAGKRGWGFSHLLERVKELGIEDKVRFLDWVPDEDLAGLYQYAGCLVYPSLQEGFGLSPLKAFKMGVPVIVSDIPVFKEVLGEAALFTDPKSVDNLAELMREVLNPQVSTKLIAAGFDRLNKYSWIKAAKDTRKIYEGINNGLI